VNFSLFLAQKTHFRAGIHENKEKRLCYFGLTIRLPIQIHLKDIKKPKNRLSLLNSLLHRYIAKVQ
jgi:hypothetical protein